jgi:nuclear mRNA export protein PCID2/THP1
MSVVLWTNKLKECSSWDHAASVSTGLSELFSADLNNPQVSSLQNDILDNQVNFEQEIESADLFDGDWPGFVELAKSYLRFCKDVDPEDTVGSFDLYAQLMANLQAAFASGKGNVLQDTVVKIGRIVVSLGLQIDRLSNDPNMLRTSYISSLLLKIFNTIRAEKIDRSVQADEILSKKNIILYVATTLCRLYFKLDQPGSCANVFSNIHTANIEFSRYRMAQKVEFRYWLGRFYLTKNQLKDAYRHLSWSFKNCLAGAVRNKRAILIHLTPPSMLLGIMPSAEMLQFYGLYDLYGPLILAIRKADYGGYMNHMRQNEAWFLSHKLYLLLRSRSLVPLFRMCLFRLWKIQGQPTTLSLEDIGIALKLSMANDKSGGVFVGGDADQQQIECVCISLISQGFIKANIFPRNRALRLKPAGAFPPLNELHKVGEYDDGLQGREKWMGQ